MPPEPQHKSKSIFGKILDWTLAPLLLLWPVSMAIQYFCAYSIANNAYDRELHGRAVAVAKQLAYDEQANLTVNQAAAAAAVMRGQQDERLFYQVRGPGNEIVSGERAIPPVDLRPDVPPETVYFRDQHLPGYEVRIAYLLARVHGMPGGALVQVAETVGRRSHLANQIIGDVIAAQLVVVPIALLCVWLGLRRGITPLTHLAQAIRRRKPDDLTPLAEVEAPEEVRPLVSSFNDLMSRLDASLKAQQQFLADAAHQMRTPLAALRMQADIALRQRDPTTLQHVLRQIVASADRTSHLMSQLLALARADSDAPPHLALLDLDSLVREATREWVQPAREQEIDLGFESAAEPALIDGNAILLRELLDNLLDNAIRYTPARGHVTTRVAVGEEIVLEVEDDGIGVAESERERVFERFYRAPGNESDGAGLGLSIVRGIAHVHRAQAMLAANPTGCGTIVRVVFPRAERAEALRSAA